MPYNYILRCKQINNSHKGILLFLGRIIIVYIVMIGAAIGAGLSAAGAIAGGIMRDKAIKKEQEQLAKKEAEERDWYNRRYNEDATARADAQRAITMTEEAMKARNRAAQGAAAVMGGSPDAVIAAQRANAAAMADTASAVAAAGEQRKDAIEAQHRATQDTFDAARMEQERNRANAIAAATQGVMSAGANIASGLTFDSIKGDKKKEETA